MTTVYKKTGTNLHALAGDSAGTSANWQETSTSTLYNAWIAAHGAAAEVSATTFDATKVKYQEPLNVGGPGAGFSDQQKFELGQAITSGVILVGDKIDETNYNISLEVPEVPGTATGTASPTPA